MHLWREKLAGNRWGILFALTSAVALVLLLGVAAFILDVKDTRYIPKNSLVEHNCFTAYAAAAYLASIGTADLYNPIHYGMASDYSTPIHEAVRQTFSVDDFEYPPPFLLLPYALLLLFRDFFAMRTAWFVLSVAFSIGALLAVAWWCGAFRSQPRLLLFPLLLCAPTVLTTIQIGNVHFFIIAISMLGMVAFERRLPLIGGLLLGFATVAKIWPAVLIAYLVLQRRWKDALYCAGAMLAFTLGVWFLFGSAPYQNFLAYQLPRLSSGKAFDFMSSSIREIILNISIFGFPHKLYVMHLLSSPPELLSPALNWGFTLFVGLVVVATGLRRADNTAQDDHERLIQAQLWLTLLTLVQLRSPFLPWIYGVITTLWLFLLLAPVLNGWKLALIAVAGVALAINLPVLADLRTAGFDLIYTLLTSLFVYAAALYSLVRYSRQAIFGEHVKV